MLAELAYILVISLLYSVGGIIQSKGIRGKRISLDNLKNLLKNKYFVIGNLVAFSGTVLFVLAARFMDVSVLQPALNIGLVITAVLDWLFLGYKLGKREIVGILAITGGVILLVA